VESLKPIHKLGVWLKQLKLFKQLGSTHLS